MAENTTDVWVGSWRPHKPRGRISALDSGPGPRFALPGTTGFYLHDPTKERAPAFSFGTRHDLLTPGPGPAAYKLPSDCQYAPEQSRKSTHCSAPGYSGRNREFPRVQTPGPAAYKLPSVFGPSTQFNRTSAPSFSIRPRLNAGSFSADLHKSPGPGTYKVVDLHTYKYKPPSYSMTGRNFMPGDTTKKPGPAAHHPGQVTLQRVKAPGFSFGVRHSDYTAPFIEEVAIL